MPNIDEYAEINMMAHSVKAGKNGYKPLYYDEKKDVFKGFFEDQNGERISFYNLLLKNGWKTLKYIAPYHWKLKKKNLTLEYVEGDVYVKILDEELCKVCGGSGELLTDGPVYPNEPMMASVETTPCPYCKK